MAAVTIPGDVYLTYSIFILTTTMRLVTFPLNLRAESAELISEEESRPENPQEESSKSKELPEIKYTNYISANPFVLPAILQRPVGLASIKDIPLPKSQSVKSELVVTPETLRYLKAVAERLCAEKHEAVRAHLELRAQLANQSQEAAKQLVHLQEIIARTNKLNGPQRAELEAKLKKLQNDQQSLLHRMDRTLQALINKASPELNEHEMNLKCLPEKIVLPVYRGHPQVFPRVQGVLAALFLVRRVQYHNAGGSRRRRPHDIVQGPTLATGCMVPR